MTEVINMANSSDYVFGANILDNLTTGMYTDSRVIYREYIQNACDSIDMAQKNGLLQSGEGVIEIYTDDDERTISIRDNGIGIKAEDYIRTLGNIANSDKTLGESKGFRGIGRLCGLAYCQTLIFSSKAQGETTISYMICDAAQMRELINQNQLQREIKLSAAEVLTKIISYKREKCSDIGDHWFEVKLINVNPENHELLARESVIDYLSFVAPVPFNKNFSYRSLIYDYVRRNGLHIDEYIIKVNGEQIFKDYRTRVKTSKGEDRIFDVHFHNLFDDEHNLIAWVWFGLRNFQAVIDKDSPQRGLRLRKENIQIGSEDALQRLFKEDRGTHYFIGEVHAVSKDLIPNSQRDYFNENAMRNIFEREAKQYFSDSLHRLYHTGNDVSSAFDKIDSYQRQVEEFQQKELNSDFVDDKQRKEAVTKVEKSRKGAEDSIKKIANVTERYKDNPESPIYKVVSHISENRDAKQFIHVDDRKEDQTSEKDISKKKTKRWVDRLSSVPKNERKLISRVIGVVRKFVDETTFDKILDKVEEEFK